MIKKVLTIGFLCSVLTSTGAMANKPFKEDRDWYVRLVASAGPLQDKNSVLGQLSDSQSGYDTHDLEELAPFASPYLTIVFPHPDWGEQAGDYSTDFHGHDKKRDSWLFEVRSDDPNREITLSWSGTGDLRRMQLKDPANDTVIKVMDRKNGLNTYTFSMGGENARQFEWIAK